MEVFSEAMLRGAHVGIVIAGNDRHPIRWADAFQPLAGRCEFRWQRQIDQIAGDGDVVGLLDVEVRPQQVEQFAAVDGVAIALPVGVAERALADQFVQARRRQRRQMRVREMCQHIGRHHALPIRIPARNTNAPPTAIWNVACNHGVSMKRWRIQEINASSTITTATASTVAT